MRACTARPGPNAVRRAIPALLALVCVTALLGCSQDSPPRVPPPADLGLLLTGDDVPGAEAQDVRVLPPENFCGQVGEWEGLAVPALGTRAAVRDLVLNGVVVESAVFDVVSERPPATVLAELRDGLEICVRTSAQAGPAFSFSVLPGLPPDAVGYAVQVREGLRTGTFERVWQATDERLVVVGARREGTPPQATGQDLPALAAIALDRVRRHEQQS